MDVSRYVKYIRYRIKKGENLDDILESMSEKFSEKQLSMIVDELAKDDFKKKIFKKKAPLVGRHFKLAAILAGLMLIAVIALMYTHNLKLGLQWKIFDDKLFNDPVQMPANGAEMIYIDIGDHEYDLDPVAKYKVSAVVAAKQVYKNELLAPTDVMLLWGELVEDEWDSYLSITMKKRQAFWRCNGCRHNSFYINAHSSNNHLIPATEGVKEGIDLLDKFDVVSMEGYLVDYIDNLDGDITEHKTSTSRADTGPEASEIFYVMNLTVNNVTYS